MELKDGAILKITWFDDDKDVYTYDSKTKLFVNDGIKPFSKELVTTEEELAYYIEHLDDAFKGIFYVQPTIKYYKLINN